MNILTGSRPSQRPDDSPVEDAVAALQSIPLVRSVEDSHALLRLLRSQLLEQAWPAVEALYEWSGFSKKGAWGQITSAWTSHFVNIYDRLGGQAQAMPAVQAFFEGNDELTRMQPRLRPVTIGDITHRCAPVALGIARGSSRKESGMDEGAIEKVVRP